MASSNSLFYAVLILYVCASESKSAEACGGFLKYCKAPFSHSGGKLRARCRTNAGNFVAAEVNLDNYLSNVNGNLVPGTGYTKSCQGFGYFLVGASQFIVTANCTKFEGGLRTTGYNVNSRVSSKNGVMKWDTGSCRRRSLLQAADSLREEGVA
ncbi:hypothetical protein MPTK1_5g13700 [Marchantia polymorpha subsp. ruderalis]|uniref:Cyanovirin-N domain-containing protein n=2 Tax=Marchantia polymorpha TaxID=3197 RepID=A0A176VCU3_MARPO|nr:hypothetical protein AXG93_4846s1210 [Marchantia polymorpha subsp. ruderalis]PTQ41865.1 hypothetical protein MARPO_0032s0060 [Marchantia polymorpha]BBN11652.1 hypothetical protein Mp_5g13700 [Marchantia polymorpha subsp. ruderalis]|eukprot:PTQ41865.1 hypothetical protein MARPO_0032s0060 [Marchantia polymorpha]